ncbi:hypothetical protein ACKWTF_007263 [Chironomus riparius]
MDLYDLSQQDIHFLEDKLSENPEILMKKDSNHRLLLHWACLSGREQLVDIILKLSTPDINLGDDTNATPLILATLGGKLEIVKLLIAKGADVNAKKQGGHSSLQYAVSKNHKGIVQYLIEKGADINILDDRLDTPLHRAASLGRLDIVKILIDKGANLNRQNRELNTPLHLALEDEQLTVGFLLIEAGADCKLENRAKQAVIDLCKSNVRKQVLEKYGKNFE